MNISYNWLKELINLDMPAEALGQRLTDVGLAVEGIHPHGDDLVFDIDLTSNRPDCLSHLGVAREVAVITERSLNAKTQSSKDAKESTIGKSSSVSIQDPELCHRFTARIIRDVKVGPSPQWMVELLEAIGERSINIVADITNYVMHELGQPMHSFDLDKLAENRIVVRRAKAGETIKTLDEVDRKLGDSMLAICDAEKPVAIGGVMGGFDSGISDSTVNVLLEVAYFKRENIRATSRKLGLTTEASYRFERGVDIENLVRASNRATELICEFAGGDAGEFIDVYPAEFKPNLIESHDIRTAVHRLTGLSVETHDCERILESLGIAKVGPTIYLAPTWRHDLAIEEDLVEEVARHAGYDKIADELPPAFGKNTKPPSTAKGCCGKSLPISALTRLLPTVLLIQNSMMFLSRYRA
jgi:phenylalanyl-tRNA synthetase beta chain